MGEGSGWGVGDGKKKVQWLLFFLAWVNAACLDRS